MGVGDPDHRHPLIFKSWYGSSPGVPCFRCELPVTGRDCGYGCRRCSYCVHEVCLGMPEEMRHPLHPQHSLSLLPTPTSLLFDCNQCHQPCLGPGYTYHCQTCLQFNLHLKCFLTLNLQEKHPHPLSLFECYPFHRKVRCHICGLLFDDFNTYNFACKDCDFFIHYECAFLPPTVKRHHAHELTFRYNYPKESNLAVCDVCESNQGADELDRTLSYYYCQRCDYIAEVKCVTTKPPIATTQLENFLHEHPMVYSRIHRDRINCACGQDIFNNDPCYHCSECDYVLHKSCAEFPRFIKHPRHKDHTLTPRSCASLNMEGELSVCNFCSKKMDDGVLILQCVDCDYAEHLSCAIRFRHPHHGRDLLFSNPSDLKFRCNACGELGDGYRMLDNASVRGTHHDRILFPLWPVDFKFQRDGSGELGDGYRQSNFAYDLHVECYGLPGRIERGCHSHPLYLISSPTKIGSDLSSTSSSHCDICGMEADPDFWIYCCKQCNYIAHLKCVVNDLLSALGTSSNNFSGLCLIPDRDDDAQFIDPFKPEVRTLCSLWKEKGPSQWTPVFFEASFWNGRKPIADWDDVLHCPKCERPISVQAYSCLRDWAHYNHEPFALLDENIVDELYCPICYQLIFPPTYSCAECQTFFHKSCAELPRKCTIDPEHTFLLLSPSKRIDSLSNCIKCLHPIKGHAYVCISCETAIDVVCALGAPLLKLENQKHRFFSYRRNFGCEKCEACGNEIAPNSIAFECYKFSCCLLHFECALLPYSVSHRIHQHPLVLETRLDLSLDYIDYVCDVCEKKLNPSLWVYRCSDDCGDYATSHVSCIITSNKKCHFKYDEECRYPDIKRLDVPLVRKMSLPAVANAIANEPPDQRQKYLLRSNLHELVDKLVLEHEYHDSGVTDKLLKMGLAEVLHLIESPDALKEKVVEAMEVIGN